MPRAALVAGPIAVLATASVVTLGVAGGVTGGAELVVASAGRATPDQVAPAPDASFSVERQRVVSRAGSRIEPAPTKAELVTAPASTRRAVAAADTRMWTTTVLNLWDGPGEKAAQAGELDELEKVLVTGRTLFGRQEVVVDGRARWVNQGYLVAEKPETEPQLGGACTNGSSVASGVSANVVKVHEAVCAAFPEIGTYGTFRSDGEHAQGIAVDVMVSGDLGWQVAEFVREHHVELGVSYLIYSQQIWSVERSGEGWRAMSDRGSATANHYDHVHVTTY